MAFHFTLETVLRYRRTLEDREQLRLQSLLLKRSTLLQQLEHLRMTRSELRANLLRTLEQSSLSAAELQFCTRREQGAHQAEEYLQVQLREMQAEVARQTGQYQAERQRRQALESLRDAQLKNYRDGKTAPRTSHAG